MPDHPNPHEFMNSSILTDKRTAGLIHRVREDVSHLREDLSNLLSHTTSDTIPSRAREIADSAKQQITTGTQYAANRLRDLGSNRTAEWVGGAVLLGLLAAGAYAITHNGHSSLKSGTGTLDEFEAS
jgi:hypothetical protein